MISTPKNREYRSSDASANVPRTLISIRCELFSLFDILEYVSMNAFSQKVAATTYRKLNVNSNRITPLIGAILRLVAVLRAYRAKELADKLRRKRK